MFRQPLAMTYLLPIYKQVKGHVYFFSVFIFISYLFVFLS